MRGRKIGREIENVKKGGGRKSGSREKKNSWRNRRRGWKGDCWEEGYSPRGWGSCRLLQHLPILDPVLDAPLSILILRAFYTDSACPEESLHLVNPGWYGGGGGFRFDFYHHFLLSIACLLNIAHLQGEPEISAVITPRCYNNAIFFFFFLRVQDALS